MESIQSSNTNGAWMSYTYDDLNRLSTVVDHRLSGSNTTTYTYDVSNNVGTMTYPNGVQSTFGYDALNRVTGLSAATGSYQYQRGANGNLTSVSESSGRSIAWSYDGINRLTSESISGGTVNGSAAYGLDPVGNRLSASSSITGVSSGSWSYNADDELTAESYDLNGNVTATGGKTFAYDAENHLVSMNGGSVQLAYDAFGNRVAKTVNGVTTRYLVEDDVNPTGYPQVFDELTGGVVTRTYSYGLQRISQQQVVSNAWTPSFYGYDGGGSVRQLTNAAGAVTDTYDYDAFGNVLNKTGSTLNEMLYRGEQYDPDLGLYYLRARYYTSLTGRFISRDPEDGQPEDPKSLHKYLYAAGDPVSGYDPTGREAEIGYLQVSSRLSASAEVVGAEEGVGLIISCALLWEGTGTVAYYQAGPNGTVTMIAPCVWMGSKASTPPFPPLPLPLPIAPTGPNWPQKKFDQCKEIDDQIDRIKKTIRASGGACSPGMSAAELVYRASLWAEEVAARELLHQDCFQNDPDVGHQQALQQAKEKLAECQDTPPTP